MIQLNSYSATSDESEPRGADVDSPVHISSSEEPGIVSFPSTHGENEGAAADVVTLQTMEQETAEESHPEVDSVTGVEFVERLLHRQDEVLDGLAQLQKQITSVIEEITSARQAEIDADECVVQEDKNAA